jgi:uncharacterized protein (DUF488 family)
MAALSTAANTLFTIGHSTHAVEELVGLLRDAGVELVVDVRRFPGSRRHPQFGRERLAAALAEAGIGYRHEEALGGRRRARVDSPNTAWRNEQLRGYADHMASEDFAAGLARLLALAAERPTAVMCAEAYWRHCHRQLLADAVAAAGWEVVHLLAGCRRQVHPRHPRLRVDEGGRLSYPAAAIPAASTERRGERAPSAPRRTSPPGQRRLPGFGSGSAG